MTPPVAPWAGTSSLQTEMHDSAVTRAGVSCDHSLNLMKSRGLLPRPRALAPLSSEPRAHLSEPETSLQASEDNGGEGQKTGDVILHTCPQLRGGKGKRTPSSELDFTAGGGGASTEALRVRVR